MRLAGTLNVTGDVKFNLTKMLGAFQATSPFGTSGSILMAKARVHPSRFPVLVRPCDVMVVVGVRLELWMCVPSLGVEMNLERRQRL